MARIPAEAVNLLPDMGAPAQILDPFVTDGPAEVRVTGVFPHVLE
jgi:hypothetical protein